MRKEARDVEPIEIAKVQPYIDQFAGKPVYIHVETTNGAYAAHQNEGFLSAGAFLRNAVIEYEYGKIVGEGPYRIGLKLPKGWAYAEGLTHFEFDEKGRLLLAGHHADGKLAVAFQISTEPFD